MSSANEVEALRSSLKAVLSLYSDGDLVQGDKVCWQQTDISRNKVNKVISEGFGHFDDKPALPRKRERLDYFILGSIISTVLAATYLLFNIFSGERLEVDTAITIMGGDFIVVGLLIAFAKANGKVWAVILTVVNVILLAMSLYQSQHEVCHPGSIDGNNSQSVLRQ